MDARLTRMLGYLDQKLETADDYAEYEAFYEARAYLKRLMSAERPERPETPLDTPI